MSELALDLFNAISEIVKLRKRIAELEAENGRLQESWLWETVCPDGSLRPKVSELLLNLDGWKERSNGWESIVETLNTRIAELEAGRRWIPVSERLPEEDTDGNTLMAIFRHSGEWVRTPFGAEFADEFVRHYSYWMYAPEPPEERER